MNKYFSIIFITLITIGFNSFAQWHVSGNTLSATDFFGSLNSVNVQVITNGLPIFDFTTNGDINYLNHNRGIQHNGKYSLVLPGPTNVNTRNTFVGLTHNNLSQPGSSNSLFGYFAGRAASM